MSTLPAGKYQLKSLHEEIDLFDRKLAHLLKYEVFANDAERDAAADKMSAKRDLLVRKAKQMVDDGTEFNESELPKSLRAATTSETLSGSSVDLTATPIALVAKLPQASPYVGTSLDVQPEIATYKKVKAKRKTA